MFKRWMILIGVAVALAIPTMGFAQDEDQNKVSVSLTAPANGTVVTAPGSVTFTAAASANQRNWAILRVEFYQGTTLIGSATTAPYSIVWQNAPAGNYTLTAKAIATNQGQSKDKDKEHRNSPSWEAVSAPVSLIVNAPPSVGLTSPSVSQIYNAPASVTVTADAADSDGTISKVEFYQGITLIGTATTAPYSVTWQNAPAGQYAITAKATDDRGATTTSAPVQIIVNAPPQVSLTGPTANQVYVAPASITVTADAADTDGTVAKVEFYQGATLIGTATAAPYAITWANVAPGTYNITAKATDDRGAMTTSALIPITVNAPPTVDLTSPTAGQAYIAPASVTVTANAADSDGAVSKVEFYQGATLIGTATAAPYAITWANASAGSYTLTAKATDDKGATTTSAPVQIIFNAPPQVSLTGPTANQNYIAPASVTVTADAADSDGTVAKVEFYQGATLIGTATAAPYSITWQNAPAGQYTLTAKATDDRGAITTSAPVQIIINAPPTVRLTSPGAGQTYIAPASVTVTADAADTDGTVAKVEFYQGATLIGTATTAPYSVTWQNAPAGQYTFTAKATDDKGATTTSAPVQIIVNAPPTVSLTSPTAGQTYIAPANVTVTANAIDSDGTIAKVEFYQGTVLIGTATTAPYSITWSNVPAGSNTLTAKVTDDKGATTTSAAITLTVIPNQLPSITLTTPTAGQRFTAPATLTLASSAQDMDGQIARVEYYQGSTLIATATAAPYTATWQNVSEGQYSLSAKATDNGGGETYSTAVNITVGPTGLQVFYLHSDHLNTPRVATDEQNRIVWRNSALAEPFGTAAPEQDPDGDGMPFTLNLRFPGQYYDKETGLNYNVNRDYDPAIGRYLQSDPIGLAGGINTYIYVEGNPMSFMDPLGLDKTSWRFPWGPKNGNYGGMCWTGGKSCTSDEIGDAPPTDSGDICYQKHDKCYDTCDGCNKDRAACQETCNKELVSCLKVLPADPRKWPNPPRPGTERDSRNFRQDAIDHFELRGNKREG